MTAAPFVGERRLDCRSIALQAARKLDGLRDPASARLIQPRGEPVSLAPTDQLLELDGQGVRLPDVRIGPEELLRVGVLVRFGVGRWSEMEPACLAR